MKSVIIHADGRRVNLAAAIDAELYEELEGTHSPRQQPVLRCGGCDGGIYIRHGSVRKDELFGAHHDAGDCRETLSIRKSVMSDEHKRQAEYHARAAERAGHSADLEVTTAGRTRVDVVVDGRIGFEIQRSVLTKAAAVDRTARSVAGGLDAVAWFTDRAESPQWTGHVPGYATIARSTAWDAMPLPGSVMARGIWAVRAVRCGSAAPCFHRRPCHRTVPSLVPVTMHVDDVVRDLAEGHLKPVRLGKYVRLMDAASIALREELTGEHLPEYDAGRPKPRMLAPSAPQECEREPLVPPHLAERVIWLPADMPVAPPPPLRGVCHVPGCGLPGRLYPGGWRCGSHAPGAARAS